MCARIRTPTDNSCYSNNCQTICSILLYTLIVQWNVNIEVFATIISMCIYILLNNAHIKISNDRTD